jgi:hypothetical protein
MLNRRQLLAAALGSTVSVVAAPLLPPVAQVTSDEWLRTMNDFIESHSEAVGYCITVDFVGTWHVSSPRRFAILTQGQPNGT